MNESSRDETARRPAAAHCLQPGPTAGAGAAADRRAGSAASQKLIRTVIARLVFADLNPLNSADVDRLCGQLAEAARLLGPTEGGT